MRRYTVLLYPEAEGGYSVAIPAFGWLATQGETVEEALARAKEAIEVATQGLIEDGEDVPDPDGESLPIVAAVEVAPVGTAVA